MPVQSKMLNPDNTDNEQIWDWMQLLLGQLRGNSQRQLLSCEGSEQWCCDLLGKIKLESNDLIILSDQTDNTGVAFSKSETLLGQESGLVVVDLFSGLNADVLCIAAGLVKCGGLLILLSPGAAGWSDVKDQYGIWQNDVASPEAAFIDYFFKCLKAGSGTCIRLLEDNAPPKITPAIKSSLTKFIEGKTVDQIAALSKLDIWLSAPEQRIALILANRGRGKSTCLGFMVKAMMEDHGLSVCVTAYSRQSAAMLLAQCHTANFVAPDSVIIDQLRADVLVIDEAAMLPFPMLDRLCRQFKRVVMATTTGGYEGTGQGFLLRFIERLPKEQMEWIQLQLPVRWAVDDCLEKWVDETLLLKPFVSISESAQSAKAFDSSRCHTEILEQHSDGVDLKRLYRLMVSAHYRTRPSDFRALMENPDLIPVVTKYNAELLGVALMNREGGFDSNLSDQVFLGKRRPKGHLLAQMLTAQAGIRSFACHRGLRIQRIAVTQNQRRQGIGRSLIERIEAYASDDKFDYIGASFAFDNESAEFWKSCGFRLVHIGYGQGKSSGNHSVAVIKVLNPLLKEDVEQLERKLRSSLALLLCQHLQHMNAADVKMLLRYCGFASTLTKIESDEIEAFTQGHKGFELCFVSLQRVVMEAIAQSSDDQFINPWLIEKVVQNRPWDALSPQQDCSGRKLVQNKLRRLVGELVA